MIDFEVLETEVFRVVPHVYLEDGFTLTSTSTVALSGFGVWGITDSRFSGSTAMFNNQNTAFTMLNKDDGQPFDIISIDLAEQSNPNGQTVVFEGFLASGGRVTQTFVLDGIPYGAETFSFGTQFRNLISVRWQQLHPFHQFDNIVVRPRD